MTSWDPEQYLRFAEERARPFHDLVSRVAVRSPATIVDLGCGPGNMTATLAGRFPGATVRGVDSSEDMIEAAQRYAGPRLSFTVADIRSWRPAEPVDLIVSNAVLQWVPEHTELFADWLDALRPGGAFAFQVPAKGPAGTGEVIRRVTQRPEWQDRLSDAAAGAGPRTTTTVKHPESYLDELARLGCAVDAWETTYYHILTGPDPVLDWFRGTGLRPYFDALADDPDAAAEFERQMAVALREAHPAQPYGTVLPFHRIFVIARRAD
ncbi:MAG: methyltransferase domain-containing protein [Actinocatenispora sp.]